MPGPWFVNYPQDLRGAPGATPSVAAVLDATRLPAKFGEVIGWEAAVPAGGVEEVDIVLPDDYPFRLEGIQFSARGGDRSRLRVGLALPSGRQLAGPTNGASAWCGSPAGKASVAFRHRFAPGEALTLTIRNDGPDDLELAGVLIGAALTKDSRL